MRIEVLYLPGCPNYEPAVRESNKSWPLNLYKLRFMASLSAVKRKLRCCCFPVLQRFALMAMMSNQIKHTTSAYPVGCIRTEVASHQRKCFDWLFQERSAKHEHNRSHDMHKKVALYSQPG